MKKKISLMFLSLLILLSANLTGCLYGTYQVADPVGQNNFHYAYYYAYAGYFSQTDRDLEDTLTDAQAIMSATVMYGLMDQLDLQIGYVGSSLGAGLKWSPDFRSPFRIGVLGAIYTDFRTFLIYPKIGAIASYHMNDNLTFSAGSQVYIRNRNDYKGEVFTSIDIERANMFEHSIPNFIVNFLFPKALQPNISYPFSGPAKKLYIGVSLRHELDFNWNKSNKNPI